MSSSSMFAGPSHYALVNAGSNPLLLQRPPPASEESEQDHQNESPQDPREELRRLYEQYAELYPNPRLVEEYRARDDLLRAASAAASAQHSQPSSTPKPGFFARLFGSRDDDKGAPAAPGPTSAAAESSLVYEEMPNEWDDGSLCGTLKSLDLSCIPLEAYAVARFHLASTPSRTDHPNSVRWGPLAGKPAPSSLVVVGLGVLAEFVPNEPSAILETSDRDDLLDYDEAHPGEFRPEYVRACALSPNCVAVSWGFQDGLVGIYRRTEHPGGSNGWEQMWIVGPSRPVLEAIGDVFHDEDDSHPGSPLLRVSDLLPLRVDTGDRRQPMVATLVLARLGGYVELLPMPTDLWFGPLLTEEPRPDHRRRRRRGEHYAAGKAIGCPTLALTTTDYHLDIQSLDALRTSVGEDAAWDNEAYPDGPPAEYILAASGMSPHQRGVECVSFWGISTLFDAPPAEDEPQQQQQHDEEGIRFRPHPSILEVREVASGAEVSVFATPGTMQHWRTPRKVELRPDAPIGGGSSPPPEESDDDPSGPPITAISTTAPVVSLRFHAPASPGASPVLAVLDWNGGATIFDCSALERMASHRLAGEELDQVGLARSQGGSLRFSHTLVDRSRFAALITEKAAGRGRRRAVGNLHWMEGWPASETELAPLVLLPRDSEELVLATLRFPDEGPDAADPGSPRATTLSLRFPAQGATMGDLGSGNVSFVSRRKCPEGTVLKYFVMQQLDPAEIVESLARESKHEEAIAAAEKLDELDQAALAEVIEECCRRLWETNRDMDRLADTRNVSYIVGQAVSVTESPLFLAELSLEKIRVLCRLAMAMGRNHRSSKEPLEKVGSFLVRLGTYELLCKHFSVKTSIQRFRQDFQGASMVEVARSVAQRGDTLGLSIVLFRHRFEMRESLFDVLDGIPLSANPESFVHLLPLIVDEGTRISDKFLPSIASPDGVHWSHMPQHLLETEGVVVVTDNADEKLVLDQNSLSTNGGGDLATRACSWFVSRTSKLQMFTGNIHAVIVLCELGLRCVGTDPSKPRLVDTAAEFQPLFKTLRSAKSLQSILLEDFIAFDAEEQKDSGSMIVDTDDLLSMDPLELVELIVGGETDGTKILTRCTDYLQPLITEIVDENGEENGVDDALSSYCMRLAEECTTIESASTLVESTKKALSIGIAIASSSTTSLPKRDRLIKDKEVLVKMVISVVWTVVQSLEKANLTEIDSRELIDLIWSIYETLPDHVPSSMETGATFLPLLKEVEKLNENLIASNILVLWPGGQPFSFFAQQRHADAFTDQQGMELVSQLCRSYAFCAGQSRGRERGAALLQDLLSDIKELNTSCCRGSLDLPLLLCTHLVRPLLRLELFHSVAAYLESEAALVDREQIKQAVLAYVDEAVFADRESSNRVMAAMTCQDIIGPVFPEIQPGFASIRRFLDASHFISTVLFEGRGQSPFGPSELRKRMPIDVIESILKDVPESIICGCQQWDDESYAIEANLRLRDAKEENLLPDAPPSRELPVLPGGAIFHLATILGLDSDVSALVVKCRVIHHALGIGLYGAAAAICRTLVFGTDSFGTDSLATSKLGAIIEIVSEAKYSDLPTKKELCEAALVNYKDNLDVGSSPLFHEICNVWASLDHSSSRFSREHNLVFSEDRHRRLMSRPAARMQRQIQAEYNADIHGLLADLMCQTTDGVVHDSLMNALSKFIIYWCISDAKSLKTKLLMHEKEDAKENLALGCSFILQIPSKLTADNCLHELQKIIADETANVSMAERFGGKDDICVPDPKLVAQLVGRGYSENAARRAVLMTRNVGYNEALGWAVTHTLDSDFNEPIVTIFDPRKKYVDENAFQMLQKSLFGTQQFLDEPGSMESLLQYFSKLHCPEMLPNAPILNGHAKKELPKHRTSARSRSEESAETKSERNAQLVKVAAIPKCADERSIKKVAKPKIMPVVQKQVKPITKPPVQTKLQIPVKAKSKTSISPTLETQSKMNAKVAKVSIPVKPPPKRLAAPPAKTQVKTQSEGGATKEITQQTTTSLKTVKTVPVKATETRATLATAAKLNSSAPIERSTSAIGSRLQAAKAIANSSSHRVQTRPTSDRSALLRRGQAALSKSRGNDANSDRRKLIEEGRALLRKARSKSSTVPSSNHSGPVPPKSTSVEIAKSNPPIPVPQSTSDDKIENVLKPSSPLNDQESEGSGWDFDNFDDM